MTRLEICKNCFFFGGYIDNVKASKKRLSPFQGHCKLLELIKDVPIAYCSGVDVCKGVKDLHTSEQELNEEEKKNFNGFYELKKELEEKYYTLDFEDFAEIDLIDYELRNLPKRVKKYFYFVKGWKYHDRSLNNEY